MNAYLDATGYSRLPADKKAAMDEWVAAHGVVLTECASVSVDAGAAVFTTIVMDANGKWDGTYATVERALLADPPWIGSAA